MKFLIITTIISTVFLPFFLSNFVSSQPPIKCPKVSAPAYGSLLKCDSTNVGDTCYLKCPQGWDVIGDCFKVCKRDGSWSGSEVMCLNRAKSCPPLTPPSGGQLSLPCLNVVGGYCAYTCGKTPPGGQSASQILPAAPPIVQKVLCTELGSWNSTPTCDTITSPCGPLIPPVSSYFLSPCTGSYNEVCRIQCNQGYYLIGDPTLTCLQTGKWSRYKGEPAFPRCLPLLPGATPPPNPGQPSQSIVTSCPPVNPPFNGYAEGSCSNAKPGESCKFGCSPGFVLSGIGAFKCGPDLKWDKAPESASCVFERSLCFNITAVPEGRKGNDCKLLTVGSTCTITCAPTETPQTPIVLKCLSNGWDNPYPKCTPNRCPKVNPISVPNAVMKGIGCSDGFVDDVCFFTCNPGYAMVGSGTLVCTETGTWSPATFPQCIPISCIPQLLPPNVVVSPLTCQARIPVGQTCTYSCSACSVVEMYPGTPYGTFPGSVGNIPGTPANGIPRGPGNAPGMPGSPGSIPGAAGSVPGAGGSVPGAPGVRAAQGTVPTTPVIATCQPNGSFDKQPPICRPIFCPRPAIPLALFSANCGTCGTECLMSCQGGYRLSTTSGWPRCLATGQWSGQFPTCVVGQSNPTIPRPVQCPLIQPPLNGYWIEGDCGGRVTSCNAACYDCFDLENYQTSRYSCVNGVWTPANVVTRCLPTASTCPDLRSVLGTGGQVIGQCSNQCGATCQYSCSSSQNVQVTKCTRQRFRETQGQTPFGQVTWNPRPVCRPLVPGGGGQGPSGRQCTAEAPNKGFWVGCTGGDDCNLCLRTAGGSCSLRCFDSYDLIRDGSQVASIIFTCTNTGLWNYDPRNVACLKRTNLPPGARVEPRTGPR